MFLQYPLLPVTTPTNTGQQTHSCGYWLAVFEMLGALGKASDAIGTYLPFEKHFPILEQTELFYASTYVVVLEHFLE